MAGGVGQLELPGKAGVLAGGTGGVEQAGGGQQREKGKGLAQGVPHGNYRGCLNDG
jgi:hypothetical protein